MATALWGVSTLAWRVAASGDPIGPRILTPLLAGAELFSQSMHGPFGWFATIVLTAGLGLSWFAVLCLPRRAGTPFLRRP